MNDRTWEILVEPFDELDGEVFAVEDPWAIRARVFGKWVYLDARFPSYEAAKVTLTTMLWSTAASMRADVKKMALEQVAELEQNAQDLRKYGESMSHEASARDLAAGLFQDMILDLFTSERMEVLGLIKNVGTVDVKATDASDEASAPGPAWLEDMLNTETCPVCHALFRDCKCGAEIKPECLTKRIRYAGQRATVACDNRCNKAWGTQGRPRVQLSDEPDDFAYLADGELGEAPDDPGTEEGPDSKPQAEDEKLNKWCVRECERSQMFEPGEYIILRSFAVRRYNKPPHTRES